MLFHAVKTACSAKFAHFYEITCKLLIQPQCLDLFKKQSMAFSIRTAFFIFLALTLHQTTVLAQINRDTMPEGPSMQTSLAQDDSLLVTVILKHQQNKNLLEIRRKLEANGFWDLFPPREARVISWQIAIDLGHIIVLKIPANAVRTLNLALENGAWGAFDTEVHLAYDYLGIYKEYMQKRNEIQGNKN